MTHVFSQKDARIQAVRKGDKNSPYLLYCEADIRLHWALLHLRFEEYFSAFTEVNKAFKLLKKNRDRFPDFVPNLKDLGILHAAVGTIPDNYRWGVELLTSLEGTIGQGQQEIEEVLDYASNNDFAFEAETNVLYAFLLLHLGNEKGKAWETITTGDLHPESNPLHCFVVANLAMRTGRNDEAIRLLEHRPQSRAFMPLPYLEFMLGLAKLRRLDADAGQYFQEYLNKFEGRHFIKEAWQKQAWSSLLSGDKNAYRTQIKKCLTEGFASSGSDKNALKEAQSGRLPDIHLLKARLLFDGGYYQKAYTLLSGIHPIEYKDKYQQLEYTYRLGRILQGLERFPEAIQYYAQTIESGKAEPWFFACNAALQTGLIYESTHKKQAAIKAYNTCLSINPDEYRTGLHQQAKAGLVRLGE
jgi:tetratricopeptide (TPR) repeat protein